MRSNVSIPNSSLSNFSAISIIQNLMENFGWQNLSSEIYQADLEQVQVEQKLANAMQFYIKEQNNHTRTRLIAALNETLQATQVEYDHAVKQQQYYQEQAEIEAKQKSAGASSYLGQWSFWVFEGIKNFFGSTTQQQIEKYQNLISKHQIMIEKISDAIINLPESKNEIADPIETNSLENVTFAHFPAIFNLSSLNSQTGFKMITSNDLSFPYISDVGDSNGDGYDDIIIGSPRPPFASNCNCSSCFVVFGRSNIGELNVLNLTTLDGINGFEIRSNPLDNFAGRSVGGRGDINGDGLADFAIGDGYTTVSYNGYVIFGSSEFKSSLLPLSSINGTNGMNFLEEIPGMSIVKIIDDINGDEYSEFIMGMPSLQDYSGVVYVVYGQSNLSHISNQGVIDLDKLNGTYGFKLNGESNTNSGYSISGLGDINKDGRSDFIIGAPSGIWESTTISSRVYVLLKVPPVDQDGFDLANLNGSYGFKIIDDVDLACQTGVSVSDAGDINGDGYADIIIGTICSYAYVIFGGSDVNQINTLYLSYINGKNGFKIQGEPVSNFGCSVSSGNFNGDIYSDLIIGAPPSAYILFGSPDVGKEGIITLTNFDGVAGFRIQGETNSAAGNPVSDAGDINADGVSDILIADVFNYNTFTPVFYVVFGDIPPQLINNSLYVDRCGKVVLTSINLAAFDKNHVNNSLVFIPTNIIHGYFENINQPGVFLANFTQQEVQNHQIQFVNDGNVDSPNYDVTVRSAGIAWTGPSAAQIIFNPMPIILINNKLIINQNQTVQLTTENLLAVCNLSNVSLEFVITNITHGLFRIEEQIIQSSVVNFSQQLVDLQKISFSHDGSVYAPNYQVSVNDSWIQTDSESANITFFSRPIFSVNQFLVSLNQSILLSLNNLCVNDCYSEETDQLQFNVLGDITGGRFENISISNTEITSFTQKNIKQNQIKFVSNGALEAPRYQLKVTDPASMLSDFSNGDTLLVSKNYLPINQNQTFYLTSENLNVSGSNGSATDIIFSPVTIQYSYFSLVSDINFPISTFRQDQVNKNQIAFIPDGSSNEPSCILSVRDNQSSASGSFPCQIDFASYPHLDHAFLKINPPDSLQLTVNNLEAFDDRVSPEQLYFKVSDIENDHFAYSNDFNKPISNFTQAEISAGKVYFIAISNRPPAFTVTVWNGRLFCQEDCPRMATVIAPGSNNSGSLSSLLIGLLSSLGTLVLIPLVKWYVEKTIKSCFSSREDTPDSQVTNEVLAQLWIGCCGVITHRQHEAYIIAFGHVIDKLNDSKQAISLRKEWPHLGDRQKREIKSIIAEESKDVLVGEQSRFCRFFKSFCSSEATPERIELQAQQIADQASPRLSQLFSPIHTTIPRAPSINNSSTTPLLDVS